MKVNRTSYLSIGLHWRALSQIDRTHQQFLSLHQSCWRCWWKCAIAAPACSNQQHKSSHLHLSYPPPLSSSFSSSSSSHRHTTHKQQLLLYLHPPTVTWLHRRHLVSLSSPNQTNFCRQISNIALRCCWKDGVSVLTLHPSSLLMLLVSPDKPPGVIPDACSIDLVHNKDISY